MARVTVRRARTGDLPAVLDLWEELMAFHARLDPRFEPARDARERFAPRLQQWFSDPDRRVLVAVVDGHVAGYINGSVADNPPVYDLRQYGAVSDICVAPAFRRQGLGRRLFAALRRWFVSRGISVAQLHVATANPTSNAFWRSQGFGDHLSRLWLDLGRSPEADSDEPSVTE